MRVSKHICISAEEDFDLVLYVHKSGIPYEKFSSTSIIFDMYEGDPHWQVIGPRV